MISTPPPAHRLGTAPVSGPSAVFVHGIEDDWRTWQPVAEQLSGWRSWSLEMPWRAGNDYRWRFTAGPADWLGAALEALDGPPDVLIGHSFGASAVLGLLAAGRIPPPRAAVLATPFYRPGELAITWRMFERSRAAFARQIEDGMRARLAGRATPLAADVFTGMFAKNWERIGPLGFLAVFEEYLASGHLPLAQVRVPVLVLSGDRDPGLARAHLEQLADRLPHGSIICAAGYDHFCHIRRADEVARIVEDFVAGSTSGAGSRSVVDGLPTDGANPEEDNHGDDGYRPDDRGGPAAAVLRGQHPYLGGLQAVPEPGRGGRPGLVPEP